MLDEFTQIEEVILYKFGYNAITSGEFVNIAPQTLEVNMFESMFSPVIKAELVINDAIGLFTNFPFTGEEIVKITYNNSTFTRSDFFVIEAVNDIEISDDNRVATYTVNLVSLDAWANARRTVQRAYNSTLIEAAQKIFEDFIVDETLKILPSYVRKPLITGIAQETAKLTIIPNLNPFAAISMLTSMIESSSESSPYVSYMFYQDKNGYHIQSLQEMFTQTRSGAERRKAFKNKYRYTSDDLPGNEKYSNEGRLVTNINFNKRHSPLSKINMGYFQNKLFEINIAQKGHKITEWKPDNLTGISPHRLNTTKYEAFTPIFEGEEYSNRTKYVVTTQKENDLSFPVSEKRNRWGRDLIAHIAMSQVDITITIEGNDDLRVGGLIYLEIPKAHGFNINDEDDLISGFFLITEKRDVISQTGQYKTSLRIQKDSYNTSVDRPSEYNDNVSEDIFFI